jgi:hypothetical protein
MANERMQFQAPAIFAQVAPQVQTDDGTVRFLETATNVFLNNANDAHKRQLQSDLDMAQKDGARIGYNAGKDFKPIRTGSLFARTYNDSGYQTATQKISVALQRKVFDLSQRNPANPAGLEKQLKGYGEEFLKEIPIEMQTAVRESFDRLGNAAYQNAVAERTELNKQVSAANFYGYELTTQNTVEKFAPLAFKAGPDGDAAREALATVRKDYIDQLAGNGPRGAYSVGGYNIKSGGGSGAYSPLEIAKKMRAFDNQIISAGVLGNFQQEVEAGRGVDAYMNVVKGNMEVTVMGEDGKMSSRKISDILTNDELDELSGQMRSYMGGISSMQDAQYRDFERTREQYNDNVLLMARNRAFKVGKDAAGNDVLQGGDPVALQSLLATIAKDPMVKPETLKQVTEMAATLGTGEINNPITVGDTWEKVTTGAIQSYENVPREGIDDKTRIQMYEAIGSRTKGMHWSTSQRYKIAEGYADAVLAPQKSAGFTMFGDQDKNAAVDRAEWNRRMIEATLAAEAAGLLPANPNAEPVKQPNMSSMEFDFVKRGKEIADEIAARRNKPKTPELEAIDTELKTIEQQMNNPKPGDDPEAIKTRFRELNQRKTTLQTNAMMGAQ